MNNDYRDAAVKLGSIVQTAYENDQINLPDGAGIACFIVGGDGKVATIGFVSTIPEENLRMILAEWLKRPDSSASERFMMQGTPKDKM